MMPKGFRTYELALQLYKECEKIKARSHLRDQLLRASLSAVLNLSEGSAKSSIKDRKRFYEISLASIRETQALLSILEAGAALKIADELGACAYALVHGKKSDRKRSA